ncbi:MAG: biotin/lipoyl-binding protein, partial [Caulobacteraceae bacterium]|nr:biotin/lipoyl-binding protein [Caulobacteraceae bacterium]
FRMAAPRATAGRVYADGKAVDAPFDFATPTPPHAVAQGELIVFQGGEGVRLSVVPPLAAAAGAGAGDGSIRTPMPGRIAAVNVARGDAVSAGAPLVVLEAMKMEHALIADAAGEVAEVSVAVGDQVAEGTVVVRLVHA